MGKQLNEEVSVVLGLAPAAVTASANGAGVDRQAGGDNFQSALVEVSVGAWTDGSHTISLEESDDDSVYTAVAAGDLSGTLPVISDASTDDSVIAAVDYIGVKQFVRPVTTVAAATTGAVYGVNVVLGDRASVPVA